MPRRRQSATSSPSSLRSPPPSIRPRGSSEAFHINESSSRDTAAGEQKVIAALVGRLVNKLPCNSGSRLQLMETDPAVRHIVNTLISFMRIKPALVIQQLASALEMLSKYSNTTSGYDVPLDTLQSQIYILHTLYLCLSETWRMYAEVHSPPRSKLPQAWPDMPPLDESLAKYVLAVSLFYARIASVEAPPVDSSDPSWQSSSQDSRTIGSTSMASTGAASSVESRLRALGPVFIQQHTYPAGSSAPVVRTPERFITRECLTTHNAVQFMSRIIARVIFFLSTSNWSLVFARIRSRLANPPASADLNSDIVELRLLEWCNVDRVRLTQALQEISNSFLNLKRPAQIVAANSLRKAMWNWIEVHPGQFQVLIESGRNIDRSAEILFDVLYSTSDLSATSFARRTRVFYPMMSMLLVVCPEMLTRAAMGGMGGKILGSSKKATFFETFRKGITASKGFEACVVCHIDIIRASGYASPELQTSGLKTIAPDMHVDLRNALFFSSLSKEISDHSVYVDGLVTLYRVKTPAQWTTLFSRLFADTNEVNGKTAIRACAAIQRGGQRLPWFPTIEEFRAVTGPVVRNLLKVQSTTILGDIKAIQRPRPSPVFGNSQTDIVSEILQLYWVDPHIALAGTTATDSLQDLLHLTSALMVAPSPEEIRVSAASANVAILNALVNVDPIILQSCSPQLWRMLLDACRQCMFATQSDHENIIPSFTSAREISVALDQVAQRHPDVMSSSSLGEAATLLGKMTFTTVLVSPDVEQLAQCTPALGALARLTLVAHKTYIPGASAQGTNFIVPEGMVLTRYKIFEALLNLPPANGRVQQQKQFRKVWRATAEPTTGAISTWLGLSQVVRDLTAKILAADSLSSVIPREQRHRGLTLDIDGLGETEAKVWQNATYFLAASAVTCQYEVHTPPLVEVIGAGLLPKMYEELPDAIKVCELFIRQLVDLLVSRSIQVRETAKDALGSELDPTLFPIVIDQMTKLISHARGSSGMVISETFNNFVDQTLIIFRLTMERIAQAEKQGGTGNVTIDLGDLLHLLVQYINRLGRDDAGLRIKLRFCHKVEIILARNASVVLNNEASVKNAILDCLVEWSTDAGRDAETHRHVPGASHQSCRELEFTCLRTMVRITDGLVLKSPGEENDTTQLAVKSRLFYRYYTYLIKVLEKSHSEIESVRGSSLVGRNSTVTYEDAPNLAISALSNLLSSNIDVGLKHCLTLGYHDDPTLRTAFMRLLLNVLQQGTRFGGLTTKRLSSAPKAYLELLTANPNNLALAVALCEACSPSELDELSMLLFRVFEAKGILVDFLKIMTEREIALTSHESELFRANSITTRILTIFAKTYGYNYVRATLQPLVHSLVEKPAECSFELDPSKAGPNDDIERNADHLQLMCQALLDLICSSTPRAPIMFRALCNHLWETIADRFPESRHSVIGSFVFLRFFCPAIVAPENIDLDVSPDTRETRRALLLITKVIQNLANNVVFGNKEPHMKVLNGFLSDNIRQVTKFLSDLAVKPKPGDLAAAIESYQEDAERLQDLEGDESVLHRFISNNLSKIESMLESLPATYKFIPADSRQDREDLQGRAALADLRRIVQLTGPSADSIKMAPSSRQKAYDDFMKHNAGRNVDSVTGAFYEGPASQNGRRIFYFIVSRFGLLDYDLLAYHIFSILEKVTDFFDLVIDLTDFSASTELPMAWLKRSIQICPPGILPCIHTLALYNPNTYARRRVRKIIANLLTIAPPVGKTIVAASSPAELAESIPFTSLALPEHSMALAYEAEHVFTNLLCLSDHEQQVPVVVKLGHDCIQVASWRKQDLTSSVKSYIIDVVRLRDIDDILSGGALPLDHLVIKHGQNETMTFISRKRTEMAQIIRAARSRLRDGPSDERTLRPSDVPGTLLNVALLSLTSGDESLRLGAFNLINELSQYFKYDMALSVLKVTSGLNIPNNSLHYVYSLSSALAQSAPHLTIEFLKEWTIGFSRADVSQKCASLHYVSPWLANLESFCKPSKDREDMSSSRKSVEELVRSMVSITVAERRRLHLAILEHVWAKLANSHESLLEIITSELMNTAVDAGLGSEKGEVAGDILVSLADTSVRGRVISRLRKTIAQTYLKPSSSLVENAAWSDISTLSRIVLALSFNPAAALDAQLYLPELFHIITLMLGCGPLLVRQTVYGITVNIVQSLASTTPTGDMDNGALHLLMKRLQTKELFTQFGLHQNGPSFEAAPRDDDGLLGMVEEVTQFLGEVLVAGATSMDCANAWRARWMSLVAATCFQHNPATQPQAFTVLGNLASDEVDDDLVYQILVAMSTTLTHFGEGDNVLLVSMLRCLCRIIPGLVPDSRYASSLFWLAVGILELGYIPLFAAALELLLAALRGMGPFSGPLFETLMRGRRYAGEPARKLDAIAGVSFDTDVGFSLVGTIYKGVRHPSSRKLAVEALMELLKLTTATASSTSSHVRSHGGVVYEDSVGLFMALLPIVASNAEDVCNLLAAAGLHWDSVDVQTMSVLNQLSLPNNSTALLLVTLVTTIVQTASSEAEKIVLYRFLAEASVEMPEVVAMAYDTLIPRMTAVLSTTSTIPILESVTMILEGAMRDQTYTFPTNTPAPHTASDSTSSLQQQQQQQQQQPSLQQSQHKTYAASISSIPSISGAREQVLEDLGMKGLGELNFTNMRADRVAPLARWVAALIDSFTV